MLCIFDKLIWKGKLGGQIRSVTFTLYWYMWEKTTVIVLNVDKIITTMIYWSSSSQVDVNKE